MFEGIIQIIGKDQGSTSMILAGVHGNETCGVEAFKKILPNLEIEKGRVLFCYGNPRAIKTNVRFAEVNLNRMFKKDKLLSANERNSYEYKRAQFIKKYLNKAEALLDIHSSFTPNSRAFIICEANAKGLAKYLPADLVVSGFDQAEPGGTDSYMNSIGKIGICIECGYLGDSQAVEIAEKSIFAFFKARGHITNDIRPHKQSYTRIYYLYMTKTNKFNLVKSFDDFEEISKGQIIGIDGTQKIRAKKAGIILFAINSQKIGDEAFLLGEKKNSLA